MEPRRSERLVLNARSFVTAHSEKFGYDLLRRPSISVRLRLSPIHLMILLNSLPDGPWGASRNTICSQFNGLRPLCFVSQSDTGNTKVESLFLHSTGIRKNHSCVLFERDHLEVTQRSNGAKCPVER